MRPHTHSLRRGLCGGSRIDTLSSLAALGVMTPAEVDRVCAAEAHTRFLVDTMLPTNSIAIVAGDSTIGKSPLLCQQAMCIAAGIPFLGMPTTQGRVLYCDLENSLADCRDMCARLARFLGLPSVPDDFLLTQNAIAFERQVLAAKPSLVVIDSLRAYRPEVTEKNTSAGAWLKELRAWTKRYNATFEFIHHLRKPSRDVPRPELDADGRVCNWMLEMEGPRALVNQTDVRVAVSERDTHDPESAEVKVKWNRRVHGDSPLVLLERVYDGEEAIGYRSLVGLGLLSQERQVALTKLPDTFTFKQAKEALGRSDDPTNKFLKLAIVLQALEKLGKGLYRKLPVTQQAKVA